MIINITFIIIIIIIIITIIIILIVIFITDFIFLINIIKINIIIIVIMIIIIINVLYFRFYHWNITGIRSGISSWILSLRGTKLLSRWSDSRKTSPFLNFNFIEPDLFVRLYQ